MNSSGILPNESPHVKSPGDGSSQFLQARDSQSSAKGNFQDHSVSHLLPLSYQNLGAAQSDLDWRPCLLLSSRTKEQSYYSDVALSGSGRIEETQFKASIFGNQGVAISKSTRIERETKAYEAVVLVMAYCSGSQGMTSLNFSCVPSHNSQ
ncbi:Receptor-like serine/threonine-protein kinase SD1-6 [Senna tora]|uniref:Receptor-like serine/threonine-protein kinase SD1-6 n=1 Tax=Senna tora TaxID=362788 RepID=A0A834WGR3_9FABA|nr:Receptor-like serine/threonine-protein kinase SD1-6 [Senna tora]